MNPVPGSDDVAGVVLDRLRSSCTRRPSRSDNAAVLSGGALRDLVNLGLARLMSSSTSPHRRSQSERSATDSARRRRVRRPGRSGRSRRRWPSRRRGHPGVQAGRSPITSNSRRPESRADRDRVGRFPARSTGPGHPIHGSGGRGCRNPPLQALHDVRDRIAAQHHRPEHCSAARSWGGVRSDRNRPQSSMSRLMDLLLQPTRCDMRFKVPQVVIRVWTGSAEPVDGVLTAVRQPVENLGEADFVIPITCLLTRVLPVRNVGSPKHGWRPLDGAIQLAVGSGGSDPTVLNRGREYRHPRNGPSPPPRRSRPSDP